uniref:Uncharacterized protein n=1 Tax=Fagus sylvatica TaxID=28930 RepID=A0A2N9H5D0_FAGSY
MAACGDAVLDRGRIRSKGVIGVGVAVPGAEPLAIGMGDGEGESGRGDTIIVMRC